MRAVAAALAILLTAGTARAAPPALAEPETFAEAEARRHFGRGSAYFKLGDYDRALAEFRAAYSLGQAPGLLFNMAQAARAARSYELASYYYRAYLRLVPDAPERAYVEERLRDMRLVSDAEPAAPAPPPPSTGPVLAAAPPPQRDEDGGRVLRFVGIGSAAAGVGLAVTAIWFGRRAAGASDDVSAAFRDHATWGPELEDLYARGRRDEKVAIGTGMAGGALVATGVVLWLLGAREGSHPRVTAAPAGRGVGVQASWDF